MVSIYTLQPFTTSLMLVLNMSGRMQSCSNYQVNNATFPPNLFKNTKLIYEFLQLWRAGATLHRGARASHYSGLSCCGAQAPDAQAQ